MSVLPYQDIDGMVVVENPSQNYGSLTFTFRERQNEQAEEMCFFGAPSFCIVYVVVSNEWH